MNSVDDDDRKKKAQQIIDNIRNDEAQAKQGSAKQQQV